jgi:hypothetical protein
VSRLCEEFDERVKAFLERLIERMAVTLTHRLLGVG